MLRRLVYRDGREWITMRPGGKGAAEQEADNNQDSCPYIGTPCLSHPSCPVPGFNAMSIPRSSIHAIERNSPAGVGTGPYWATMVRDPV
jgi:hypothetical protein